MLVYSVFKKKSNRSGGPFKLEVLFIYYLFFGGGGLGEVQKFLRW